MANTASEITAYLTEAKSYRDRAATDAKTLEKIKDTYDSGASLDERIRIMQQELVAAEAIVYDYTIELRDLVATQGQVGGATQAQIDTATVNLSSAKISRDNIKAQLNSLISRRTTERTIAEQKAAAAVASAATRVPGITIQQQMNAKNSGGQLVYNASAVKEAYFSTKRGFTEKLQYSANSPVQVTEASQLWATSAASKGMIVTSEQVLKAWSTGSNAAQSSDYFDRSNYGFLFQYNPGTVSMSYFTSPNVDVTMITSGTEMFNLAGVSGAQGSINFQIIINRIFDMQYYTEAGTLKQGFIAQDLYPKPPAPEDLKNLYNKGTMYDIEYLLRTLMGTTMSSYLRGEKTADMGWLPAIPVELHLGKSLRYLGTVNSLNINHIIFNDRMVPLFTTVDIAFARLPDYPPSKTTTVQ